MKSLFKVTKDKILNDLKNRDGEDLLYRLLPLLLMEVMSRYFRLEVEGAENLPAKGRVLITPNHSGYSGFDALMLSHVLRKETKRPVRVLTHKLWFMTPFTAQPAQRFGFFEATSKNGEMFLKKNQQVVLFPEGEKGNFKPSTKAYRLQEFKRGFIRLALSTQTPIVPTLILGAEETHINLKEIQLPKFAKNIVIPLPLNVIPLPVKWKIVFLEPYVLPYSSSSINDTELVHELAGMVREKMQSELRRLRQ